MKLLVAFGFRETCWENDLNIEQCLHDPNKEYDNQKWNQTGGDDHNCCCFNETIQQVNGLFDGCSCHSISSFFFSF